VNKKFQKVQVNKNHVRDLLKQERFVEAKVICDELSTTSTSDAEIWHFACSDKPPHETVR
jgi:hypothetical protein